MFLSDSALAETAAESETGENSMMRIKRPEEVTRGTLLFRSQDDFSMAPVLETDVQITVTGMIARTVLTQNFENPLQEWQEGVYVFPLPEDAAVDYMRLHIGERVIEGQVREKEQARKEYKQAKDTGRRASLVEQERPNIFTTSVANIAPGETVQVEIRYQNIVQYDSGKFHLRFPMVVGPRYIPGNTVIEGYAGTGWSKNTDQVDDASRITPPVLHPELGQINPVSICVQLHTGFPLESISSTYHGIRIEQTGNARYEVVLENGITPANRDFQLVWQPEPAHLPRAALFSEDRVPFRYAMLMLLPPQRAGSNVLGREMIFVIDTSGSMAGTSIKQAREALVFALDRLRPGDRFNIIQFNSTTSQLFTFPQPYSHQSLRQAKHHVMTLKAKGGTEMAGALHTALEYSDREYSVRQVIFMTDGSIGNEKELFKIIRDKLGNNRLFTVGIGSAPNGYFMRQAAELGRGTHTYIGKVSEVNEKMQTLFRKLENPVLAN
ncbi:MAG: marine proteobacterial sortase target protein, partial [Gammaproteobacteria bacterium]|nr:marine proteobacterial sortase target protein [Gammaproteobacteria bacterium]